jgi:hypothetical protein
MYIVVSYRSHRIPWKNLHSLLSQILKQLVHIQSRVLQRHRIVQKTLW